MDVFRVEVDDDAVGAVGESPSRKSPHGFAPISPAAEFRQEAECELNIADIVGAADERGNSHEPRRQALAFIGEQHPTVPALPFGIV
jgi:hypothetical protein